MDDIRFSGNIPEGYRYNGELYQEDALTIESSLKILTESLNIINNTKNVEVIIGRVPDVIRVANKLAVYQDNSQFIQFVKMSKKPTELIKEVEETYDDFILDIIKEEMKEVFIKVDGLKSAEAKQNRLNKFLSKNQTFKEHLKSKERFSEVEEPVKTKLFNLPSQLG